jgi:hypothetical protein
LWCFVRAANLEEEIREITGRVSFADSELGPNIEQRSKAIRDVLQRGRDCPMWMAWDEGFDPKEHQERRRQEMLEADRRVFDERIASIDQRSQELALQIMDEQRKTAEEHARTAKSHEALFARSEKQAVWFQFAFLTLAVIALLLAILPLAYPNGFEWLTDNAPGAAPTGPSEGSR